jgi:hypothetical protein
MGSIPFEPRKCGRARHSWHRHCNIPARGTGAGDGLPQPIQGDLGATILGPRNVPLERENPDLLASPQTDHGTIPNLKFSFANARNRLLSGGWVREVTVRELPIEAPARTASAATERARRCRFVPAGPSTI